MALVVWLMLMVGAGSLPAGTPGDTTVQFIFPLQDKHVHASSIVALPNGDLLTAWFEGSGERSANDVRIRGARLRKGARRWSPVFEMADTPNTPDCNPVLFLDARNRLHLFWIAVIANRWEMSLLRHRVTQDYQQPGAPVWQWQDVILLRPGDEFADAVRRGFAALPDPDLAWAEYAPPYERMLIEAAKDPKKRELGWMTRTHPLELPGGRILLPLYSDGFNFSLIAISDDGGDTWRPGLPIVGRGNVQPTLLRRSDGAVIAYMRDNGDPPGRIMRSVSKDGGESWSPARDGTLPNPGSSVVALALADGRWVLVYNDTEKGRHRLAIALSDDEGRSWKWRRYLDRAGPDEAKFHYPAVVQTPDGRIHITYTYQVRAGKTIKHVSLPVQWLLSHE